MKDILKIIGLALLGLVIALVVYPLLHEGGHILATTACGGSVKEVTLFPLPNVLCDASKVSENGMIIIGMAGILLPFVFSAFAHPKSFTGWYGCFVLKGIVLLSMIVSMAVIIMNQFGTMNDNDDMIKVLKYWDGGDYWILLLLLVLTVVTMLLIAVDHPIKKILKIFGI